MLKIISNNVPRPLLSGYDLTDVERTEFDYIGPLDDHEAWMEGSVDRFVRYKGELYDLHEFVRLVPRSKAIGWQHGVDDDSPLLAWQAIMTDSFFSALVLRYTDGLERVVIGRVTS